MMLGKKRELIFLRRRLLIAAALAGCLVFAYQNCSSGFTPLEVSNLGDSSLASSPPQGDSAIPSLPTLGTDYNPSEGPVASHLRVIAVNSAEEALQALKNAQAGDEITFEDGVYLFNQNLELGGAGTAANPIFVRARNPLKAKLNFCNTEGFRVTRHPYWIFENLDIEGVCHGQSDGSNEHAFHISGNSDHVVLRGNRVTNFKSHVKMNGGILEGMSTYTWPSDLWIIKNIWRDLVPVGGAAIPHNALNIDGGNRHVIRGNSFVDLVSSVPDERPASAIYLKMTVRDFVVEQNFVLCQKHVDLYGDRRGIYSGDVYGASPYCDGDCANLRGVYRNNIVMNCNGMGNSSGLNLNNEKASRFLHNTLFANKYDFRGDVPGTDFTFIGNILYNGWPSIVPTIMKDNVDLTAQTAAQLWSNPAAADFSLRDANSIRSKVTKLPDAGYDFCGHVRADVTDIGAIDYAHPRASECVSFIRTLYNSL
jgi:hypothetical protein